MTLLMSEPQHQNSFSTNEHYQTMTTSSWPHTNPAPGHLYHHHNHHSHNHLNHQAQYHHQAAGYGATSASGGGSPFAPEGPRPPATNSASPHLMPGAHSPGYPHQMFDLHLHEGGGGGGGGNDNAAGRGLSSPAMRNASTGGGEQSPGANPSAASSASSTSSSAAAGPASSSSSTTEAANAADTPTAIASDLTLGETQAHEQQGGPVGFQRIGGPSGSSPSPQLPPRAPTTPKHKTKFEQQQQQVGYSTPASQQMYPTANSFFASSNATANQQQQPHAYASGPYHDQQASATVGGAYGQHHNLHNQHHPHHHHHLGHQANHSSGAADYYAHQAEPSAISSVARGWSAVHSPQLAAVSPPVMAAHHNHLHAHAHHHLNHPHHQGHHGQQQVGTHHHHHHHPHIGHYPTQTAGQQSPTGSGAYANASAPFGASPSLHHEPHQHQSLPAHNHHHHHQQQQQHYAINHHHHQRHYQGGQAVATPLVSPPVDQQQHTPQAHPQQQQHELHVQHHLGHLQSPSEAYGQQQQAQPLSVGYYGQPAAQYGSYQAASQQQQQPPDSPAILPTPLVVQHHHRQPPTGSTTNPHLHQFQAGRQLRASVMPPQQQQASMAYSRANYSPSSSSVASSTSSPKSSALEPHVPTSLANHHQQAIHQHAAPFQHQARLASINNQSIPAGKQRANLASSSPTLSKGAPNLPSALNRDAATTTTIPPRGHLASGNTGDDQVQALSLTSPARSSPTTLKGGHTDEQLAMVKGGGQPKAVESQLSQLKQQCANILDEQQQRKGAGAILLENSPKSAADNNNATAQQQPQATYPTNSATGNGNTNAAQGPNGGGGNNNNNAQQQQNGRSKRLRTSFKHNQLKEMKRWFSKNQNPDAKDLKTLAQTTGLSKRVLQVWFQNARAKFRRNNAKAANQQLYNVVNQHTSHMLQFQQQQHHQHHHQAPPAPLPPIHTYQQHHGGLAGGLHHLQARQQQQQAHATSNATTGGESAGGPVAALSSFAESGQTS